MVTTNGIVAASYQTVFQGHPCHQVNDSVWLFRISCICIFHISLMAMLFVSKWLPWHNNVNDPVWFSKVRIVLGKCMIEENPLIIHLTTLSKTKPLSLSLTFAQSIAISVQSSFWQSNDNVSNMPLTYQRYCSYHHRRLWQLWLIQALCLSHALHTCQHFAIHEQNIFTYQNIGIFWQGPIDHLIFYSHAWSNLPIHVWASRG